MNDSGTDTILGSDIVFKGKLSFKNKLKINGVFKGQIETSGQLIVGNTGDVEADIEAGTVSVQGKIKGNILATHRIDIFRNAELTGDIRTPDLQIEAGSVFSGHCIMDKK
jgi:cytoskeletal protein CcmA (bactofilin family)